MTPAKVAKQLKLNKNASVIMPLIFAGVAGLMFFCCSGIFTTKEKETKLTRQERIEMQFSGWNGSHKKLVKLIKESMNDPKSFEHVKTIYFDRGDHLHVRTEFRGKNAFGGTVKDMFIANFDLDGKIIQIVEEKE